MLTDSIIKHAIKAQRSRILADGCGRGTGRLTLRIRPAKGRVIAEWYVQQFMGERRQFRKIGSYPALSLAEARRTFDEEFSGLIAQGKNIKSSKTRKSGSVADLFGSYVAFLKAERKTFKDSERVLRYAAAAFGESRKANEVTTEEVIDFLRPIFQRGSKIAADRARGTIRAAYSWAMKAQNDYRHTNERVFDLRYNPAEAIPTEPKTKGDRWLEASELREFIRWIDTYKPFEGKREIMHSNLLCLKLACMLGQRVSEITTLRAEQYNRMRRCLEWQDTKSGRAHVLPLPPQAVRLIESIQPNEHGWFFPSKDDPKRPTHYLRLQAITRHYVLRNDKPRFSPRDFRRTFKTLAGFAGISKTDRDRLQNHAQGDISSRHYDRYDYLEEKKAAMDRWSEWWRDNIENEPQVVVVKMKGSA